MSEREAGKEKTLEDFLERRADKLKLANGIPDCIRITETRRNAGLSPVPL